MAGKKTIDIKENVAGISVADGVISMARVVRHGKNKLSLTHAGWTEYNTHGSDAELVSAIRGLWKKTRMPTRTVCCGLHTHALCLKYFKYPDLAPRELSSALSLEAEEALQLPPDEIALDWHLNRPRNDPYTQLGEQLNGILVAVSKKEVNHQLSLMKRAGLFPVVVDVSCTSICNLYLAMRAEKVSPAQAVCVVNLTEHSADISILYDDHYIYPRTIVLRSAEWASKQQYLIENISDALLYYHVKVARTPVTQLVITGSVPQDPTFVEKIHDTIDLPTEVWNPLSDKHFHISHAAKSDSTHDVVSPIMTTSLGLSLRNG
ncbi:MAG TPA: pilus assembly protein PilM [Pontiella sp.]